MLRIAVNLRSFYQGRIGGVEAVIRNVVLPLAEETSHSWRWTLLGQEAEAEVLRTLAPSAEVVALPPGRDRAAVDELVTAERFDALFCPLLVLEPLTPEIPAVVVMPDLQHEVYPENFERSVLEWRRRSYRASALHARAVITHSEHARKSMIEAFGIAASRVRVIPHGVAPVFEEESADVDACIREELGLDGDYLYYPANFWPHKNHATLLRALQLLRARGRAIRLVLTGAPSTGLEGIGELAHRLGLAQQVQALGYLPEERLPGVYRGARVLVFPSLFEGFGLPILEAFAARTPVIASRSTSCPEVAGAAALLVDPLDAEAIAMAVERVLEEPGLAQALIAAGETRVRGFSWQRARAKTREVLERAFNAAPPARIEVRTPPTVSIVTPSLDKAPFLEQAILSVLDQDYPHLEYWVLDGGSSDGTREILERYAGRLRYRIEPDEGQADAVNKGLALCSGSILAFLNADDTYLPGAVRKAVDVLERFPGLGMAYGEGVYIDQQGEVLGRYPTFPFDAELLERNCFICQPTSFVRAEAWHRVGGLDPRLHYALDYDLWIRLAARYPLHYVAEQLATSRLYPDNKTLGGRGNVYRETTATVLRHYGYAAFDWIYGYAHYLLQPHASFLDLHPFSKRVHLLALVLGLRYNRRQRRRFLNEWLAPLRLERTHRGFVSRWEDGWISKRYRERLWVGPQTARIVVAGRYPEHGPPALELSVSLDGRRRLRCGLAHGAFQLAVACPPELRSRYVTLELRANRTFCPGPSDPRRLSCLLDEVRCE